MRCPDGGKTRDCDGATLPGIYDLRNIRPSEYKIKLMVPVDMIWSFRYQGFSQLAEVPVFERAGIRKNPEQTVKNPGYYLGPYGRYGTAAQYNVGGFPGYAAKCQKFFHFRRHFAAEISGYGARGPFN